MQHRTSQERVPPRAARTACLAVLGALFACAACQSAAPTASREPPAASPPAALSPQSLSAQSAQPAAQAAPQALKAAVEPSAAAPEPTAVKLAANAPAAGAVALADAPSAKKGDDKAAPAGKETQGTAVTEEAFSAWLQTTSPAKAGGPVQLEAVLVAKPPYHCNPEYPHKFKLNAAPAGLSYPEETVRGMKVTPARSVLAIPVNAQSAGKQTITGTLSFSVCTDERCMVEKRDLSVALDVM
jgi:hypothetical protein